MLEQRNEGKLIEIGKNYILTQVFVSLDLVAILESIQQKLRHQLTFLQKSTPDVEVPIYTTPEVEAPIGTSTLYETPTPSPSIHPEPLKKDVKCKLYVGQSGDVVALGRVVATKGNVHGKILAPGNYCMAVDKCLDGSAKLPVSVGDDMTFVVHAVNNYVAWPSHLIITYDHEQVTKVLIEN
ncbi:uncharacterized protein LOC133778875 [Humulus lupulus]|uniref:uncharacterized protein LOC133778875 n=1 Tax=Humulus lupulus TaxID=3486 RepID=UPI002B4071C0|nr:uncharacterized protein LOC133778875 [Humulus lupulus]